ncbi:MAG: hypothetical protein AAGF79_03335 [Pseudomonadota bacterium]
MALPDDRPDDETLLDYIADRLDPDSRAAIETQAAADPELATDIALMRSMRQALQTETDAQAPGALGWKRLERAIEASTPATVPRRPMWQVAAAAAVVAVLGWQFVAMPVLNGSGPGLQTASDAPVEGMSLTVAFVPDSTEAQIRDLLVQTGGQIVEGPSALGLWQVQFDNQAARDAALDAFGTAPSLISHVQAN